MRTEMAALNGAMVSPRVRTVNPGDKVLAACLKAIGRRG